LKGDSLLGISFLHAPTAEGVVVLCIYLLTPQLRKVWFVQNLSPQTPTSKGVVVLCTESPQTTTSKGIVYSEFFSSNSNLRK
jgi:hypothetical protein